MSHYSYVFQKSRRRVIGPREHKEKMQGRHSGELIPFRHASLHRLSIRVFSHEFYVLVLYLGLDLLWEKVLQILILTSPIKSEIIIVNHNQTTKQKWLVLHCNLSWYCNYVNLFIVNSLKGTHFDTTRYILSMEITVTFSYCLHLFWCSIL